MLRRACAPANCGCTFSPFAKRCSRSSNETASTGGPMPTLFWTHPYQSPRLRRSSSPMVPKTMRLARLRRPKSAWNAAPSASRLGCWAPQLIVGQRSGAGATLLARASITQRAWYTWRLCPHGKRTAPCPSWSVNRQTPHAILPLVSPRKARRRVPFLGIFLGALEDPPADALSLIHI